MVIACILRYLLVILPASATGPVRSTKKGPAKVFYETLPGLAPKDIQLFGTGLVYFIHKDYSTILGLFTQ